jgi:hypothetical protein
MARTYQETLAAINADTSIDADRKKALAAQAQEQEYGSKAFNIDEFEQLLGRLESSKGRQQRQKSTEGRRDIFAQGLASMMGNF